MEEDTKTIIIICLAILLFVSIICVSSYMHRQIKIENFQATIKDLSPEQKCLHICAFEWNGAFENYKFCTEKCDRISERLNS